MLISLILVLFSKYPEVDGFIMIFFHSILSLFYRKNFKHTQQTGMSRDCVMVHHPQLSIATHGHPWSPTVTHGHPWSPTITHSHHSHPRSPTVFSYPQSPMVSHPQSPTVTHSQSLAVTHGHPQPPTITHSHPQSPMGHPQLSHTC